MTLTRRCCPEDRSQGPQWAWAPQWLRPLTRRPQMLVSSPQRLPMRKPSSGWRSPTLAWRGGSRGLLTPWPSFLILCSRLPHRWGPPLPQEPGAGAGSVRPSRQVHGAVCSGLLAPLAAASSLLAVLAAVTRGRDSSEAGDQCPGQLGSRSGGEVFCPPSASVLFLT